MKIAIVGAGITGITTAVELMEAGHAVTVFEQHRAAAEEASFAPAGLMWPCIANPWGATAFAEHLRLGFARPAFGPLDIKGNALSRQRRWGRKYHAAAKHSKAADALPALQALELLSMQRMQHIQELLNLNAQFNAGCLIPLRKEPTAPALYEFTRRLSAAHVDYSLCTAAEARALEPGLATDIDLSGALHIPDAWSGNGRFFGQGLLQALTEHGLQVLTQNTVTAVTATNPGVHITSNGTQHAFDAAVLCTGQFAPPLLRTLGMKLPLAAIEGFSLSTPIAEQSLAPRGSVVDIEHGFVLTRQGTRLRISGGAQLGYADTPERTEEARHALTSVLLEWFPGSIVRQQSVLHMWRGARLTAPDGLPVLGASSTPGVWLNLAHGGHGWGLAMGCAHHVRQLIDAQGTNVDAAAFGYTRFQ